MWVEKRREPCARAVLAIATGTTASPIAAATLSNRGGWALGLPPARC